MAQGRYTYTLDVENSRALKKLADFAKASDKATQRFTKDISSQKKRQQELGNELLNLKRKYAEAQKAAKDYGGTARTFNKGHVESLRKLKEQVGKVREEYAKSRRELVKLNLEQRRGATQYSSPMGPAPARRGFGGNAGRRANFARGMAGRFGASGLGTSFAGGMAAGAGGLVAGGAVLAVAGLTKATLSYADAAARAATQQSKFQKALVGVLGNDTKQGLEAINSVVKTYNVPLASATENFTRLAASTRSAGVSTKDAKKVFEGMIVANKALGGSNEQLNGILLATQQVFSKGKVTAEELRGQIGERLPGAVSLFATSMGITTAELDKRLEEGTVSVDDFVKFSKELFNEFGDTAKKLSDGPEEAGARLSIALNELQINVGKMLGPVGAAFQNVFTGMIKLINQATLALMRFYNIGLDNRLNTAIQARVRAEQQLALIGDRDQINLGGAMGTSNILTKAQAEKNVETTTAAARKLQDDFNKSLGIGQSGMQQGDLLTSEDLINNRSGKGKGNGSGNAAADAARRLAQVQAQEIKKLAALELKIFTENAKILAGLRQQSLTGEQATQQGILNTFQNSLKDLEARQKKFLDDVTQAESNLLAAQNRLAAAQPGADTIKAQGAVDIAQAQLSGAQSRSSVFNQNLPTLQGAAQMSAQLQSTAPFREAASSMKAEVDLLRTRNRLVMEGFSGPALEGEMRKAEFDQQALDRLKVHNEERRQGLLTEQQHAEAVAAVTDANVKAKEAVDALTEAQQSQNGALQNYVVQAQSYISNVQERMAEIAQTIEEGITEAITGVLNGTMSATEAFQNFFKSVGQAFAKMAAQMIAKLIIIRLLKGALSLFSPAPPTPEGPNLDLINQYNSSPMEPFAKGGIVTRPTNALIGEGSMNEAVVPLPNGRAIPVDMGKNAAGNVQTNITVNVDQGGNTESDVSGDNANKLGLAINNAVKRVIMDERRAGGLLHNGRR